MNIPPDITVSYALGEDVGHVASSVAEAVASPLAAETLGQLPPSPDRFVASAPGRLDVMGGIAEYAGALVLNVPIADHVCVAAQPRTDRTVTISLSCGSDAHGAKPTTVALRELHAADGRPIVPECGRRLGGGTLAAPVVGVVGVLVEMLRARLVSDWDGGLSIVVGSKLDGLSDVGRNAAVAAATMAAAAGVRGMRLDPALVTGICQRVESDWLSLPASRADAVCALLGRPGTLTQVHGDPAAPVGATRLPDELILLGVDSGATHPDTCERNRQARTSAHMGRVLVDRIVQHEGPRYARWNGQLARLSVIDYVERFRDRLPAKIKGSEFLSRFGQSDDPGAPIEPDVVYKVRARTEHCVYEHARSCRFVECLSRSRRADLTEAGGLMYASHWSYGHRCGLGSLETDLLVQLIRSHGRESDILGAKVTSRGCGGVVAVLMRATDCARSSLDSAVRAYEDQCGRTARFIRGSSPGVLVSAMGPM